MDWIKYLLIISMGAVTFMLVKEWAAFDDRRKAAQVTQEETTLSAPLAQAQEATIGDDGVPVITSEPEDQPATAQQLITVSTDNLIVKIDTQGGDIVYAALPKHLAKLENPQPFVLLNQTESHTYVAQSGLVGANGTDGKGQRPVFATEKSTYALAEGEDTLVVDLTLAQGDVTLTKRFTFKRDDYLVDLTYLVDNRSSETWKANFYAQIKRDSQPVPTDVGFGMNPYLGAAITTADEKYKKVDFEDMAEATVKDSVQGGWVALVQHYFISAWIANPAHQNTYTLRRSKTSDLYFMGYTAPAVEVAPGSQGSLGASFYVGPKDVYTLEEISPYLDLTVDYGWLWWIAKPLFQFLTFIYGFIGNWGWSIIALTIVIKAIFFPLSAASYRSMAKMRKLGPLMQDLKERYGDDRQKMSAELMKMYKKEKVNPMGGCLPILVQMPVFIALYWVLMESVELRHTPFLGWIEDLSVRDPLFILPVLMGATMFVQFKLNPTPPDPTQAKVMQMMPIFMTFMFMWFPAGLVLYWVANNTISIIQQYVITRQIEADGKA
ncbi:membrane protein insertase YidC [Simiduia sp. 21SJ11W-1]|uniref:membrane protein insertase YidC n=1 Tax=Simiduia sp. 21SJ11W-1 TaxID=2909669 RepID=UPI0035320195